ncbi:MAG: hypothetical protein H6865_00250 [Rhodospirillales bacterium]|nr:hypothetical protein [Alphaproteobacteria bacterium]MCB9986056.1 hypothetical protein [Rhodospirillales bacterium]USO07374.1 MAG: hypothetical protein H6866_08120 [Rhodospirillales bacterium]
MTMDYADHKVSEALRLAGGNAAKARRQIQAWFYEDVKLLLELTRPHWAGIVAHAVDRAAARAERGEDTSPQAAKKAARGKGESSFGKEMLRSFVSEKAARFGHEAGSAPVRSKTASQAHVDTIHLLAAKAKQKPKRKS